jgi:uncharacterized Zn-finger protein
VTLEQLINTTLSSHIKIHTGEKKFSCDLYDYRTECKTQIKDAQYVIHTGEQKFSCDLSDYRTEWKRNSTVICVIIEQDIKPKLKRHNM